MSSVSESFAHDDTPRGNLFAFLAHLFPYGLVASFLFTIYGYLGSPGVPPLVGLLAEWVSVIFVFFGVFHFAFSRLCIRCMQDIPLNMAELAQKRKFWLKMVHVAMERRSASLWLIGYGIAVLMARWAILGHYPTWSNRDYSWLGVGIPVTVLLYGWAVWQHHRLRPECPYCRRWDEGGAREPSPDPQIKSTIS